MAIRNESTYFQWQPLVLPRRILSEALHCDGLGTPPLVHGTMVKCNAIHTPQTLALQWTSNTTTALLQQLHFNFIELATQL